MKELIEVLKQLIADDEEKLEETLTEEEVGKIEKLDGEAATEIKDAVDVLIGYKMQDMPDDAVGAIRTLAKQASCGQPIEKVDEAKFIEELADMKKAGARFSKTTVAQLNKIKEIVEKLIGQREKEVSKGHKELPDDVKASLEELAEFKLAEKERLEKEKTEKSDAEEARIKKLEEEIEELKKKKGFKKSIDGQKGDKEIEKGADDEKELEDPLPSFPLPCKIKG